jgi:hypothetical protein
MSIDYFYKYCFRVFAGIFNFNCYLLAKFLRFFEYRNERKAIIFILMGKGGRHIYSNGGRGLVWG